MNDTDTILLNEVKRHKTPSVQYILFSKDHVIKRYSAGLADIKNRRTVSEHTTYHAFSVTKTFTALAVLQLAEQKKLDVTQAVSKYLPDFPYHSEITILQLLNHSAGIPNPIPLSWIHLVNEHPSFDGNQFFKKIFAKNPKLRSKPNEKYAYSNLGYVLLGQLIEKVSGTNYETYVTDNIIKKLGIENDLSFEISEAHNPATGYHKRFSFSGLILGLFINKSKFMAKPEGKWRAFKQYYINGAAYGGLTGTPIAFVNYLQELLKTDCRLITNNYKNMLFTENYNTGNKATGMCLSWFSGELNGNRYFSHAGGGGGYYCEIRLYPNAGTGSVIFFNRTGMKDEKFLDKVDKYYFENSAK